jgi:hypothetical protein
MLYITEQKVNPLTNSNFWTAEKQRLEDDVGIHLCIVFTAYPGIYNQISELFENVYLDNTGYHISFVLSINILLVLK